jgi:hypothetical protein
MVIGALWLNIYIPSSDSLKDKRAALRGFKQRVKNNFNVSVSEVGELNKWQKAEIGVAAVGKDRKYINGLLDKIVNFCSEFRDIRLLDYNMEIQ